MPRKLSRKAAALVRSVSLLALGAGIFTASNSDFSTLEESLARRGLRAVPASIHWIDPADAPLRRAMFLARASSEGAKTDLFIAHTRTTPGDRVIALSNVYNLSNSPAADEDLLTLDATGTYAAFVTRVEGRVDALSVVDTRGERAELPSETGARVRLAITRWQRTGRPTGYGIERFELTHPVEHVSLRFDRSSLLATLAHRVRVRIEPERDFVIREHPELVRHRPRVAAQMDAWVPWTVNLVRAVPWIGAEPIEMLESIAFGAEHQFARLRQSTVGTNTARDDAQDLQDVLSTGTRATHELEGPVEDWPPAALTPMTRPALPHEGEWSPLVQDGDPFSRSNVGAPSPMYITFLRPDPERLDGRTFFAAWDPRQIELHVVPGSEEPIGATGETGTGAIPRDASTMSRLVAGFNGAFQALHGEFGVFAEGMVLLPPKPYAASLMLLANGDLGFGSWPRELRSTPDEVVEFRQNMTAIVDEGQYNPWRRGYWGGIHGQTTDTHTTRTAICLTRANHILYAWGDHIEPSSLGRALIAANCRYAIHLDMNGVNTGFELYRVGPPASHPPLEHPLINSFEAEGTISGLPGMTYRARKLVRRMGHNLPRYIRRDPRDFFYLLLRSVLPGPAISPPISPALPGEGTFHVQGLGTQPFPWPMARTRLRPDPTQPDRSVNLLRIDPRRVRLAPADTREPLVARFVGGAVARGAGAPRVTMSRTVQGPRWVIGTEGDGLAGETLAPNAAVLRGAGIDREGYLVLAVTDRAVAGVISQALDRAGCGPARIALGEAILTLPSGQGALGEAAPATLRPTLALTPQVWTGAQRMFPEVTPVSPSTWMPPMQRRVRYIRNPDREGTVRVNIVGGESLVLPMRGWSPPADAGASTPH
ncbi:MAG: hypothetical protein Q8Q09_04895 [Deltaproteobacteria bacterium]|nr:hypothetical protein [Deltaproteobacteria bacterium]